MSGKYYRKKFEKNNPAITLKVLYAKKEEKMYPASISKHNSNSEKQIIQSIISKVKKII